MKSNIIKTVSKNTSILSRKNVEESQGKKAHYIPSRQVIQCIKPIKPAFLSQ